MKPARIAAVLFFAACTAFAAPKAPRHVTHPLSTITVKVVTAEDYARKAKGADPTVMPNGQPAPWILTTYGATSCTAWVSAASKVPQAGALAYEACRKVLAKD